MATEAERIGLLSAVVPKDKLMSTVAQIAKDIVVSPLSRKERLHLTFLRRMAHNMPSNSQSRRLTSICDRPLLLRLITRVLWKCWDLLIKMLKKESKQSKRAENQSSHRQNSKFTKGRNKQLLCPCRTQNSNSVKCRDGQYRK